MEREATRSRSPGYPSFGLPEALTRARKVFEEDRRNPIDREVVAKHMGYSGSSGAADKAVATLMHYDLLERVAKGEVRISQLAIDIIHPENQSQYKAALQRAAFAPTLFKALKERFPDGRFSESALRSFLVRLGFLERAIDQVVRAYTDTCRLLEQADANESGGPADLIDGESDGGPSNSRHVDAPLPVGPPPVPPAPPVRMQEHSPMGNERILTTGLLSKESSFRLIVNGRIGVKEIEVLIKKLEIDKEILAEEDAEPSSAGGVFD